MSAKRTAWSATSSHGGDPAVAGSGGEARPRRTGSGRWVLLPVGVAAAVCLAGPPGAQADAIDGNWCAADGRAFSIDGPRIVTPGGAAATGDYSRHGFAYVVPAGETDAGGRVVMVLLDEETVRLTAGAAGPEIWRRCDVTS